MLLVTECVIRWQQTLLCLREIVSIVFQKSFRFRLCVCVCVCVCVYLPAQKILHVYILSFMTTHSLLCKTPIFKYSASINIFRFAQAYYFCLEKEINQLPKY